MAHAVYAKFDTLLTQHLKDVDLARLCRVDMSRFINKALPHIGIIEMVSGATFASLYDPLYTESFPKRAERERSDLIVERLDKELSHQRGGLAPYRIIGIRDLAGTAIGAAQFSVLPIPGDKYAVPYLQYIYIRSQNRRQDMSEVLYMMILAVSIADSKGRSVPFTLFETDPPGHGHDEASQAYAHERAMIHTKGGSVAMMLRRTNDGVMLSPHIQPGLEVGDPPLSLVWVIKQSPAYTGQPFDVNEVAASLIATYYQGLRDEGFPEANIGLAERMFEERAQGAKFELVPLSNVKPTEHANSVAQQSSG